MTAPPGWHLQPDGRERYWDGRQWTDHFVDPIVGAPPTDVVADVPLAGEAQQPDEKRMRLRYAGTCRVCGAHLPAKAEAVYERETKSVRCLTHDRTAGTPPVTDVVEPGIAGASARREYERRKARREERVRAKHPVLGGLILNVSNEKQSTTAWSTGALGEERLGRGLDRLASDTVRVLHDRRIPRTRANIDHIAVTRSGVYVIDAKKYKGRPQHKVEGGLLRPRVERLIVGSRDCTKLVDSVFKQVEVVRSLLDNDVPIRGMLCFVDADWGVLDPPFATRGVYVAWPKKLYSRLKARGPLDKATIAEIHRKLAEALPPA